MFYLVFGFKILQQIQKVKKNIPVIDKFFEKISKMVIFLLVFPVFDVFFQEGIIICLCKISNIKYF